MMIIPSRGRPELVERFIKAYRDTNSICPVLLRVDDDDPKIEEYSKIARVLPPTWLYVRGRRMKCPEACQWMFEQYPNEPWYALFGDDVLPQTPHWDKILIEAAGTRKVSYGFDPSCWPLATHPVVGGDIVRAVGYYAVPSVLHWYMDTLWYDIAIRLGRLAPVKEVLVPHLHLEHENKTDQTNDERFLDIKTGIMHTPEHDIEIWNKWNRDEMDAALERVKRLCPL